jgi:hypothetical protein
MNGQTPEIPIEHLLRELAPQVLGVVARRFRDFSSAEDAVQEAMLAAFRQWPREGIPENPRGWLIRGGIEADDGHGAQRDGAPPAGDRDDNRGGADDRAGGISTRTWIPKIRSFSFSCAAIPR